MTHDALVIQQYPEQQYTARVIANNLPLTTLRTLPCPRGGGAPGRIEVDDVKLQSFDGVAGWDSFG